MKEKIKYFALENAIKFNGKANPGAIVGKILALDPELKKEMGTLGKEIAMTVKDVNSLSLDDQKKEFESFDKIDKPKREERKGLPDLPDAVQGKVVTRIPPEPSKYNHIGHALSFLINYMYAVKYEGKCLLKFEDTNPEKVTQEFADAMEEDILEYLGIKADKIIYISSDMEHMYNEAVRLIKLGKAYVCFCNREDMQDLRHEGKECCHCEVEVAINLEEWQNMLDKKYKEGEVILRLKADISALNQVMRDPVLFRISYTKHYKHGDKYCVWPLYDFENSVEDCNYGVTHILRSNEFGTMRNELQNFIKDALGYKKQTIVHYGRFNIKGATTKGREIRELIQSGKVTGWDDPSLVTLRALKRRGIVKETFYEMVNRVGMSKNQSNIDWTLIESINRSILDPTVNRYFFIKDPIKIKVNDAPNQHIELNLHPDHPKRGSRKFTTKDEFYVTLDDKNNFREGKLIRLMDCLNFKLLASKFEFDSTDYEIYKNNGSGIIQWLPVDDNAVEVEIRMPDNKIVKGLAEGSIKNLKIDDVIQFQRFGFCRLDEIKENKYLFWFTNN